MTALRPPTSRLARRIIAASMTSPFVLAAHQGAAADPGRGAQLASLCAACHRLDGRDEGIPSIVGVDAKKLIEALGAFRSGERPSQIMHAVAVSLSDEETAAVAEYLAVRQNEAAP
jgi:cytochrome c553